MLKEECKIGLRVYFGRPNGNKTLGEVTKLNAVMAKVKLLEDRGDNAHIGEIWSVPYSLMTCADDETVGRSRVSVDEVKRELSKQLQSLRQNGFAYIEPVLREALFGKGSLIDWEAVRDMFETHNPEKKL